MSSRYAPLGHHNHLSDTSVHPVTTQLIQIYTYRRLYVCGFISRLLAVFRIRPPRTQRRVLYRLPSTSLGSRQSVPSP